MRVVCVGVFPRVAHGIVRPVQRCREACNTCSVIAYDNHVLCDGCRIPKLVVLQGRVELRLGIHLQVWVMLRVKLLG